jgi:phosphoenolpyruvate carboxykinase (GTP)
MDEARSTETFFETFNGRVPAAVTRQLEQLKTRLSS